jgi:hypothetical protein
LRPKFKSQPQINIWDVDIKVWFFVEIMVENMDKVLIVPKWVLIIGPKILQMLQNLSAQFVCPSPKVLDFNEKRHHWASIVSITLKMVFLYH